jgi:1,4-dihydroxy-2-naphthoate octaprenyltransferase
VHDHVKPPPARIWLAAARPRTLPAAIAPVISATALAWHDHVFRLGAAAACLAFALLIQIGTNFANDYYDFIKGADTAERVGPRRAVASGWVQPNTMRLAMWFVFGAAFAVGLSLLSYGGWPLLAIGVASIICGIAYTGGPYPLGYNGLGDVFVFIFFGLVAVCATYFVQAGQISRPAVIIAIGVGALATNILVVNNYRDVETDQKAGKRTLVVRFGRSFAQAQFATSVILALGAPVALWLSYGFKPWAMLALFIAPLAARHLARLRHAREPMELIRLLGDTGKLLALYAVLLSVGLVVGN